MSEKKSKKGLPIPEGVVKLNEKKSRPSIGRKAELKNCKWHFHRDLREVISIHVSGKNNNKNIVPIT